MSSYTSSGITVQSGIERFTSIVRRSLTKTGAGQDLARASTGREPCDAAGAGRFGRQAGLVLGTAGPSMRTAEPPAAPMGQEAADDDARRLGAAERCPGHATRHALLAHRDAGAACADDPDRRARAAHGSQESRAARGGWAWLQLAM